MKTFEESAPHGGTTLFFMSGVATSPAPLANGFDPNAIREELEELGDEMNCEIDLEDMQDDKYSASFYAGQIMYLIGEYNDILIMIINFMIIIKKYEQ